MRFVINDAYLPATLTAEPMTDDEFDSFCAEHPDAFNFEATSEGDIIVMTPHETLIGVANRHIGGQPGDWAKTDGRGVCFGPRTGFVLPNGARRSPDNSWLLRSRIPRDTRGLFRLCPDFVVELKSESDRLRALRTKMREYMENGAQLAWLIDPEARSVEVYRPDLEAARHEGVLKLEGEAPVAGFVLDLTYVWDPLAD